MNRQLIDITFRRELEAASNAQVLRHRELIEQELAEEAANAKDLSESDLAAIKAANKKRNDAKNASAKKPKPQDLFASQPEEEDEVSFGVSTPMGDLTLGGRLVENAMFQSAAESNA
eukprot:gene11436-17117_t